MEMGIGRRHFLRRSFGGIGGVAGAFQLTTESLSGAVHHRPRAKHVIHLYMEGGPSQVDTFDFKPELERRHGEKLPFKKPATVFNSSATLMKSPFRFRRVGESGSWVSELFPHVAECVDELTFVHSLHHEVSNHSSACYLTHTGDPIVGRPCLGSWVTYGLGSTNESLPAFVVLDCGQAPAGGAGSWSSGFLPASHQGVKFNRGPVPVEFLERLDASTDSQRAKLRALRALNGIKRDKTGDQRRIDAVIASYEQAARLQNAIPEVMDVSSESNATQQLYGMSDKRTEIFGSRCLMARRLVERGVRFVEIFSPRVKADRWDQHGQLAKGHRNNAVAVDRPIAGLLEDLKRRGLLDETIVLWGGEFGRTPTSQLGHGRDHNPFGYTVWLAGGGFRPGVHFGATDEFGYFAQEDPVHVHDLHATILHQLGMDHERLTYRYGGRDYRLTDVFGRVIREIC